MFANKKIIMVMPERLGDTLMCTPAIYYLKYYYPTASIYIIALSELAAETLQHNPAIEQIFILPSQKMLKNLSGQFDIGINIHDGPLAREYLAILNIPIYSIPEKNPKKHQAEQALEFIQSLIPDHPPILERHYRLYPNPTDFKHIEELFKKYNINTNKTILIGCQVGCHSIAKRRFKLSKKANHPKIWPVEYISALAEKLHHANPNIRLVITGSKSESALGKKLAKQQSNIINFINQTTVLQLSALMQSLKLFISADTGLLHLACSSNIPLIALFGPTNLQRTGPYPELSNLTLLQAPNMSDIKVEDVFNAVMARV